ncbi:uncharacterized protein E5676_scaffold1161G00370 [Cucumis melo var. makuwa]|uniref:Envelope-like protein n=1 Tax=Cucumis melo var. makuwa TaxID=1194695 RepID=A0A5D3BU49_CUCMM|nr:uncharacterized protein E5676_scaffold1161G00370 [Cucumis melo var. makuwa]
MVNMRRGKYQARSPKIVAKVSNIRTNMHGVRMRGHHFKSNPSRRPYELPSEKNQVSLSDSLSVSLHDENVSDITHDNVESELVPSKSHLCMDLDERDDVPLARLLKKGLFSKVGSVVVSPPAPSIHSNSSSSSHNVFLPTPGQSSTMNENLEHTGHCPPIWSNPLVETQHSLPSLNLMMSGFPSSHPSNDVLAFVLSRETWSVWLVNGISTISLSVKYVIIHKIDIVNWFPSSHASNIPIPLPRFFSSLLVHLNIDILSASDAPGPYPKTLSLSYMLFQGSYVSDLEHDMKPSRNSRVFDSDDVDDSAEGFFVPCDLASRIIKLNLELYLHP